MARTSGVGSIVGAFVRELRAANDVTSLVPPARIANEIVSGTTRPYLVVSVVSETDDDTLGLGGVDAVVSVTVVSDYRGADEIGRIASAVRDALDGGALTVTGFAGGPADVTYEQAIGEMREDVAGVTVRHRPLWFRVRAV